MPKKNVRTLERGLEQLSIGAEEWASVLLLASNEGWKPNRPSYFFLASDFQATEEEAQTLSQTVQRIWAKCEEEPFNPNLKPNVDLGILLSVGAFCINGAFVVR